jgi:hypothetical protein
MSLSFDSFSEGTGPLVLIVYENFGSGACVPSVLKLIDREVGGEDNVQIAACRFDSFQVPEKREQAAKLAQHADIIIIAPASNENMPGPVRTWFSQWIGRRKDQPGALVAVFTPASEQLAETCSTSTQLRDIANEAGMDYFCTCVGRATQVEVKRPSFARSERLTPSFAPRWG